MPIRSSLPDAGHRDLRTSPVVAALAAGVLAACLLAGCGDDGNDQGVGSTTDSTVTTTTATEETIETETTSVDQTAPPPQDVETLEGVAVTLTPVAEVSAPTVLVSRSGSPELFVGERAGRVRTLVPGDNGTWTPGEVVVDITSDTTTEAERGLLGVAFDPEGLRMYVSFTDRAGDSRVDEWTVGDQARVDPGSRRTVFTHPQPYANHNGGHIAFGPDGLLYLALGDGGGGGDPLGAGQDPDTVLGSIIRIDPTSDGDQPYTIPADNPFADGGGAPEIFIMGVRNPWRFSWDAVTRDLWIADVGQNAIEEINFLAAAESDAAGLGANLGWSIFEGDDRYGSGDTPPGYVGPIHTYRHGPGCSVTGGYVSRDARVPSLFGAYLYSDYCDPTLYGLVQRDGEVIDARSLDVDVPGGQVVSFGQGPDHELYVLSLSGGIFRLDAQ